MVNGWKQPFAVKSRIFLCSDLLHGALVANLERNSIWWGKWEVNVADGINLCGSAFWKPQLGGPRFHDRGRPSEKTAECGGVPSLAINNRRGKFKAAITLKDPPQWRCPMVSLSRVHAAVLQALPWWTGYAKLIEWL